MNRKLYRSTDAMLPSSAGQGCTIHFYTKDNFLFIDGVPENKKILSTYVILTKEGEGSHPLRVMSDEKIF